MAVTHQLKYWSELVLCNYVGLQDVSASLSRGSTNCRRHDHPIYQKSQALPHSTATEALTNEPFTSLYERAELCMC